MEDQYDVIVVGAGWYGLVAARTYLELAPSTKLLIVDDGKTVGGVWSRERIYPSLYAQISYPLFEYSFFPMSDEGLSPDGFVSGETIHKYLDSFAREYGLVAHLRLRTSVRSVRRGLAREEGDGWTLAVHDLEHDRDYRLGCRKLIYATGANSSPIIPRWPRHGFEKPVIHSLDIGRNLEYIAQNVRRATVVGRSKSAYDTVFHLLDAGVKVDWVMRDGPSGPFSIYAPTFMGLWNIADHISTRAASSFSPCIWNTSGPWHTFLQRSFMGRAITKAYWWTATSLSAQFAGYSRSPEAEKLRPRPSSDGVFWGSGGIGITTVPNFWEVFHSGDVKIHQTEVESLSHKDVVSLRNGYAVATDIVIHCTGFDKGYSTFGDQLQTDLGLAYDTAEFSKWSMLDAEAERRVDQLLPYIAKSPATAADNTSVRSERPRHGPNRHYRRLVVPELAARGDRSMLFPGHVHSAFTPTVAELQALWGVTWMLGWRDLPSRDDMEMEAAMFNAWTRKRYLEQGKKHSYFIYDYLPYMDLLMRDLGLKTKRKDSLFSEMFVRYRPSDYRGLLDEYLAVSGHVVEKKLERPEQNLGKKLGRKQGIELNGQGPNGQRLNGQSLNGQGLNGQEQDEELDGQGQEHGQEPKKHANGNGLAIGHLMGNGHATANGYVKINGHVAA